MQPDPKQPNEPKPTEPSLPEKAPAEPIPAGDPITPNTDRPTMNDFENFSGLLGLTQRSKLFTAEIFSV